ncbi:hypothetical protein VPH35_108762 [Triticum aestivum]
MILRDGHCRRLHLGRGQVSQALIRGHRTPPVQFVPGRLGVVFSSREKNKKSCSPFYRPAVLFVDAFSPALQFVGMRIRPEQACRSPARNFENAIFMCSSARLCMQFALYFIGVN